MRHKHEPLLKATSHSDVYDSLSDDGLETKRPPPRWRVHCALALVQLFFGGGAVVGKLGLVRERRPAGCSAPLHRSFPWPSYSPLSLPPPPPPLLSLSMPAQANDTNPVLFALVREGCAAPILMAFALWQSKGWVVDLRADGLKFALAGFCLFANRELLSFPPHPHARVRG